MPAGNDNQDICSTPIGKSKAVIVGASEMSDKMYNSSNYGSCITLFAPGHKIPSTYVGSETSTSVLSGTEMAAAHVAGLLAYLQSFEGVALAPEMLKTMLLRSATRTILKGVPKGTPNVSRNKFKSRVTNSRLQLTKFSCLPSTTWSKSETSGVMTNSGSLSV